MPEAEKRKYLLLIFLDYRPLNRVFVQNKINVLFFLRWKIFHAVPEKIKTIVLCGSTVFFKDQPELLFFQKGTKEFGRSKSCKFFDPKRKAVVGPPDPAAQDHPVTAGSHGKNDQRIFDDQVSAYKKTGAHLFIQNNRTVLFCGRRGCMYHHIPVSLGNL